jgi:hypothetical protein
MLGWLAGTRKDHNWRSQLGKSESRHSHNILKPRIVVYFAPSEVQTKFRDASRILDRGSPRRSHCQRGRIFQCPRHCHEPPRTNHWWLLSSAWLPHCAYRVQVCWVDWEDRSNSYSYSFHPYTTLPLYLNYLNFVSFDTFFSKFMCKEVFERSWKKRMLFEMSFDFHEVISGAAL